MPTDGPIGTGFNLNFYTSQLTQSNLGGFGPDSGEEVLRFSNFGQSANGESVDLTVSVGSGYEAYNTEQNAVLGDFGACLAVAFAPACCPLKLILRHLVAGQINLKADHQADVTFCFQDTATGELVVIPQFTLVFHDFGAHAAHP